MNWLCNNIQSAFFLTEESKYDALELWEKLFGEEPAMFFKGGAPNPMNYPGAILGGPCDDMSVILGLQKTRLDLWITPLGVNIDTDLPPTLPDIERAISLLHSKSKAAANEIFYNRIGVIINLAIFFEKKEEAISLFNEKLGNPELVPNNSKEAIFRYNEETKESINDFQFFLNNIIDLNIFSHRNINLQITENNFSASTSTSTEYTGLSKKIDINMVKLKSPVSKDISSNLIDYVFSRSTSKYKEA